ncbi:MAG: hypothetical protein M1522_07605 [Actinobacteria bacterium]|nr:hypothetical protein [Actinomycetota bacterium]
MADCSAAVAFGAPDSTLDDPLALTADDDELVDPHAATSVPAAANTAMGRHQMRRATRRGCR